MPRLASSATVTAVGLTCKLLLNSPFSSLSVTGLSILTDALESSARDQAQGVLTVANHISTLDDPVTWGILPAHYYLRSRTTRWALGASDIMFTNPLFSTFFRLGQTLETFRGKGIHQPAVDFAIKQLDQGGWVHLYGEGKVNQPNTYLKDENGFAQLPRFKWGVGRMIMEAKTPPVIIPMWLTGFDQLMPEGRSFPYKYLPRPGAELSVTFGNPIPPGSIRQALLQYHHHHDSSCFTINTPFPASTMTTTDAQTLSGSEPAFKRRRLGERGQQQKGWLGEEVRRTLERRNLDVDIAIGLASGEELPRIRSRITAIVHDSVQSLGRSVSGRLLCTPRQK